MVYTQGTRVDKNEYFKFKKGAFHIAAQHNIPILPVVIAGTSEIWPKHSTYMNGGKAHIHTFEPIYISDMTREGVENFIKEIQDMMHKKYIELTN